MQCLLILSIPTPKETGVTGKKNNKLTIKLAKTY